MVSSTSMNAMKVVGDEGVLDSEEERRMHLVLDRDRIPSCYKLSPLITEGFEEEKEEKNFRWRWLPRVSHESDFGS